MTDTPTPTPESFLAIRRTDGDDIGDYGYLTVPAEEPWKSAADYADEDETVEFELIRLHVEHVETRTLGGPKGPVCEQWVGKEILATSSWVVTVAASGDDDVWPGKYPYPVAWSHRSKDEAKAVIAGFPETFWIHLYGDHVGEVHRDRLTVVESVHGPIADPCDRCKHRKDEHA